MTRRRRGGGLPQCGKPRAQPGVHYPPLPPPLRTSYQQVPARGAIVHESSALNAVFGEYDSIHL